MLVCAASNNEWKAWRWCSTRITLYLSIGSQGASIEDQNGIRASERIETPILEMRLQLPTFC